MPSYVAFLRAINLGASRKFPQADIRAAAETAGCTGVETHINTGNLRVTTPLRSRARVEAALERAFLADRGFEVPTVVFTPGELRAIVAYAEALATVHGSVAMQYVSLLKEAPAEAARAEAEAASYDGERLVVRGRAVHLLLEVRDSYHTARLGNAWVERRLGVSTNRNLTVLQAIARKWCGPGT